MRIQERRRRTGFTLIEALLSIVLVGLAAAGVGVVYGSGLQTLAVQGDRAPLDSHLRSRMEMLISTKFDQLSSGSASVSVNGANYTITWTVATIDLDGDLTPEPTAKEIDVTLAGRTLTTIVIDPGNKIGKL